MDNVITLPTRQPSWAKIGTDIPMGMNTKVQEALEASSLNWTVEKVALTLPDGSVVPDRQACVTHIGDKTHYLGTVSPRYEIVQNVEAFEFTDYISSDIVYKKAGITHNGMVYLIGQLPETKVLDDVFSPYVIFQNSFNGRFNLAACITPLRIVCQNQFAISFKESTNKIMLRHSKQVRDQLMEGKRVLMGVSDHMSRISALAEQFATIKLSSSELAQAINMMFPLPVANDTDNTKKVIARIQEQRERFMDAYKMDDNRNYVGTAWGLVNAYTDFMTHYESSRNRYADAMFLKNMESTTDDVINIIKAVA